jgi:hypothetical protein
MAHLTTFSRRVIIGSRKSAPVGESEIQETQYSRVLQSSVEVRMRSIQEKISIAFTFCATVEIEMKYGRSDRAKELFDKLHSTIEKLTVHINNPRHVTGKQLKEFQQNLVQLRRRMLLLESQMVGPDSSSLRLKLQAKE